MSRFNSLLALLLLASLCAVPGRAENLKLLISVQQQNIAEPDPVRATLHFHNSGQQTFWFYRPVQNNRPPITSDSLEAAPSALSPGQPYGGSTLAVHLKGVGTSGTSSSQASGSGFAILPDALPYPRLVRLGPGDDYEENVTIHVEPARQKAGDAASVLWGNYRFSVTYSAGYSNAAILARDVGARLWQGKVGSNSLTLNLQPPADHGTISGTVVDAIGRPYGGALVTLSDENENALNQLYSNDDGRFSFTNLTTGRYWLTVRQPGTNHDTSVFRRIDLSQAGGRATPQIMMLPVEISKPDRVLHKPVIFRIVDGKGHPVPKGKLAILYSSENVIQNLKTRTGGDGFTSISLIPGSNFVTIRVDGCRKEQRTANVAPGPGVDGFQFVYECTRH